MTHSNSSNKKEEAIQDWSLPEFGLQGQASHTITKKLKAKSIAEEKRYKHINEQAYQESLRKGFDAGMQQATQEMNKKMQLISAALTEFATYKQNYNEQLRRDCLSFILMICEKILMEKIKLSPEILQNIINKAIEHVDNNVPQIKISGSENVAAFFDQKLLKEKAKQIIVEIDKTRDDFSFTIESDKQVLDFHLQDALNKLINESIASLLGNNPSHD